MTFPNSEFFNTLMPGQYDCHLADGILKSTFWKEKYCNFLPESSFGHGVLSLPASVCVCQCVCLCVNHLLVRAITRDPLKLESPNLDQRWKTT